ncbi:hypothetical protein MKS88_002979 [Plasmodium brasilianum]|uniref:Uncharacterized protein n=1 Tax=Plasmodium brasilianum TaxID=5824 RepID=A0ACB9YAV3_PLABR|nr:hypothetical protein MKS88_002979 [Plasmodium brasilianum]
MLIENRKIVRNVIFECNDKLKLYIKIKQSIKNNDISKSVRELEECYKNLLGSYSNKFYEIKCYNDDYTSDTKINNDIINRLSNSFIENSNGCVISFFNKYGNIKISKDNSKHVKNNNSNNSIDETYISNLIDAFFIKTCDVSVKKNEKKNYSLRYGIFTNSFNLYDLLEDYYYEHMQYYQKIKSCTLKCDEKIDKRRYNNNSNNNNNNNYYYYNYKNVNTPSKSEIKKFIEKTRAVVFSDSRKLKDMLSFAEKQKRVVENKLKKDESFFCTLLIIDISRIKEEDTFNSSLINNNDNHRSTLNNFYFINVYYTNDNNYEEENNKEDNLRKSFIEFSSLIKHYYTDKHFKIDISNFNKISKIISEIFYDLANIHIKIVLHMSGNYDIKKKDEPILNFLHSIDLELKEFLNYLTKNVKKLENVNSNLRESSEDTLLLKNEKYHKINNVLFKNIDLDQKTKCNIIKEAMNIPEEYVDRLVLLNKTFQHNYSFYKEKEKDLHKSIKNLVEKQNDIIKNYEQEEEQKKRDINGALNEITYINEKCLELKNEIKKHKDLNSKYLQGEKHRQEQNLIKFQTADGMLAKEYTSFLKFRNESSIHDQKTIGKEEDINKFQKDEQTYNANEEEDKIQDICKKKEEEYLKNLNEAIKYAERIFQETYDLKKQYDSSISRKIDLLNVLKMTASKFNEKINSLVNNFKNTKELKLISPLEDNCVNLKERFEQTNLVIKNCLKDYKEMLDHLDTNNFNESQLNWIYKMNSLSKKF